MVPNLYGTKGLKEQKLLGTKGNGVKPLWYQNPQGSKALNYSLLESNLYGIKILKVQSLMVPNLYDNKV